MGFEPKLPTLRPNPTAATWSTIAIYPRGRCGNCIGARTADGRDHDALLASCASRVPSAGCARVGRRVDIGETMHWVPRQSPRRWNASTGRLHQNRRSRDRPSPKVQIMSLFPHVYAKLGYDSERDLAPVSTVCTVHFILTVGPLVPPE